MALAPFALGAHQAALEVSPTMLSSRGGILTASLGGPKENSAPILTGPDGSKHLMKWREGRWEARVWVPEAPPKSETQSQRKLTFSVGPLESSADQILRGSVHRGQGLTLRTYRSKPVPFAPGQGMTRSRVTPGIVWPFGSDLEAKLDWQGFWGVWSGQIIPEHSGPHEITLFAEGVKDLKVTLDRGPVFLKGGRFSVSLKAGEAASLRVEAKLDESSQLRASWKPPIGPEEPLPASRLEPDIRRVVMPSHWTIPDDFPAQAGWQGGALKVAAPTGGEGLAWCRVQQEDGSWLLSEAESGQAEVIIPANASRAGRHFQTTWLLASGDGVRLVPGPDIIQDPAPPTFASPMPDAGLDPDYLEWEKALEQGAAEEALPPVSGSGLRAIYEPLARAAARREGLNEAVFVRMIEVESAWDPNAMSPVGAMGLGQLMPDTAFELGVEDPFDPVQNLAGAAKYLAKQHRRFGSYLLALAAYNAGPGAVSRHGGVPPYRETRRYVRKILGSGR